MAINRYRALLVPLPCSHFDGVPYVTSGVYDVCGVEGTLPPQDLQSWLTPRYIQVIDSYLVELFDRIDRGTVATTECLTQTKVDGVPHFGYNNDSGGRVLIEAKDLASHSYRVSSTWVKRCVANAVNPIIESVGLSDVQDLMGQRY